MLELYPEPSVLERLRRGDDSRYAAALLRLGMPKAIVDPVSRVFLGFAQPLGLELAAGELFVPPELLRANLALLPAPLGRLGPDSGRVERDVFAGSYLDALCRLHQTSKNQPATCP